MSVKPLKWYSGTRGPYPGQWFAYRSEGFSRFIEMPDSNEVEPTVSLRGDIHPWDWCQDVSYFDPTKPWLAFIPTSDPAAYQNSSRKQSWIFPQHSNNQDNFRVSSRGGFTLCLDIIKHATTWLPRIKRLADDVAQAHRWTQTLPDPPNVKGLALRLETLDQVGAHLWSFRRSALTLLGFIHYFLNYRYISAGLPVRDFLPLKDQDLYNFIKNHLLTGQSFRGVLVETGRFCQHYKNDSMSCEHILQLLDPRINSRIPLVIHHPPSSNTVHIPWLTPILSLRTLKARLGKQTAYMMKERTARSGVVIPTKMILARARVHHRSITLQSELDGINLILFFFNEPLHPGNPHADPEDDDDDDDPPDLLELESADFHDFDPQHLYRLPDPLFRFGPEPSVGSLGPRAPLLGNALNPPMLRPGE